MLHGDERVHRLARLAHRDDEGAVVDDRVAVAELVRELDIDGDPRPGLDGVLADEARVGRGAAGEHDDAVDVLQDVLDRVELGQLHRPVDDAAEERLGDGIRLLADLLLHEGRPAALLGGGGVPRDLELLVRHRVAREVGDLDALADGG